MRLKSLALAMFLSACAHGAEAPVQTPVVAQTAIAPLDVRFYPGGTLRTYELDQAHGAKSLLVHNIAVVNSGPGPVAVTKVEIELLSNGAVRDVRTLGEADLKRAAAQGSQMQQAGMLEPLAFMFGGEQLLPPGTKLSAATQLAAGEAIIISTQLFGYTGARDQLRVRATGDGAAGEAIVAITGEGSKTAFILPLNGVWVDGAGPSVHSHHRWVPMEQFAHDFLRVGPDQKSFTGDGTKFSDYHAYGQPVLAAAAGTVVAASDTQQEDTSAMRKLGETMEAYIQRLQGDQMTRLSKGSLGILGNYIVIDHGNNEHSLYAHLKPGSVAVKTGQRVEQAAVIAAVGSAGNSTEPHLHFQACLGADPIMCTGIPVTWSGVLPVLEDFPRAIQSGDVIYNGPARQ